MIELKNTFPPSINCKECNALITPMAKILHNLPPVRVKMWTNSESGTNRWCVFNQTEGYYYPEHKCTKGGKNSNAWKGANERGSSLIKPQEERTEDRRKIMNAVAFFSTFNKQEKELR